MATPGRRVEVYEDEAGEWRWRRIATANGEPVADSGEGYTRHADAVEAAEREFPDDEVRVLEPPDADDPAAPGINPMTPEP